MPLSESSKKNIEQFINEIVAALETPDLNKLDIAMFRLGEALNTSENEGKSIEEVVSEVDLDKISLTQQARLNLDRWLYREGRQHPAPLTNSLNTIGPNIANSHIGAKAFSMLGLGEPANTPIVKNAKTRLKTRRKRQQQHAEAQHGRFFQQRQVEIQNNITQDEKAIQELEEKANQVNEDSGKRDLLKRAYDKAIEAVKATNGEDWWPKGKEEADFFRHYTSAATNQNKRCRAEAKALYWFVESSPDCSRSSLHVKLIAALYKEFTGEDMAPPSLIMGYHTLGNAAALAEAKQTVLSRLKEDYYLNFENECNEIINNNLSLAVKRADSRR